MTAPHEQRMEERRLWSVSPSAVVAYRKCQRTWYYGYVLRDRGPTPQHMAKGTSVHAALEHYMKTGEILIEHENKDAPGIKWPVMEAVQAVIPYIAPPFTSPWWEEWQARGWADKEDGGVLLEAPGELGTWNDTDPGETEPGPSFTQYIDMVERYPDSWVPDTKELPWYGGKARITDYKTTSDFRYAKTPEELSVDPQLCSNAKWLMSVDPTLDKVVLRHIYILMAKGRRAKAKPVEVEVTREHVDKVWQETLSTIREMVRWVKLAPVDAEPLTPNPDHCSAYGGCYYRQRCGITSGSELVTIRGKGTDMNLLAQMMANAQKPLTAAPAATTAAPAATTAAPAGATAPVTPPAAVQTQTTPAVSTPAAAVTVQTAPTVGVVIPAQGQAAPASPLSGLAALLTKKPASPAATPPASPAPAATPPASPPAEALTPEKAAAAAVQYGYPTEFTPATALVTTEAAGDVAGIVPPDAPSNTSTPEEVAAANPPAEEEKKEETEAETEAAPKAKRVRKPKAATTEAAPAQATLTIPTGAANTLQISSAPPTTDLSSVPQTGMLSLSSNGTAVPMVVASPMGPLPVIATAPGEKSQAEINREILKTPDPAFPCGVRVLFIDCVPGKGWPSEQPEPLYQYMHGFERLAAQSAKVADYRMIKYESKGYLAAAIKVSLANLPPVMSVNTDLPGADIFLSQVLPYAQMVLQGTR